MKGDKECAIVLNLPEGSYTALVGSKSGMKTALAVVAAFDFETGATISKLKGISTNATVTPDALMVAGVTQQGEPRKLFFKCRPLELTHQLVDIYRIRYLHYRNNRDLSSSRQLAKWTGCRIR